MFFFKVVPAAVIGCKETFDLVVCDFATFSTFSARNKQQIVEESQEGERGGSRFVCRGGPVGAKVQLRVKSQTRSEGGVAEHTNTAATDLLNCQSGNMEIDRQLPCFLMRSEEPPSLIGGVAFSDFLRRGNCLSPYCLAH